MRNVSIYVLSFVGFRVVGCHVVIKGKRRHQRVNSQQLLVVTKGGDGKMSGGGGVVAWVQQQQDANRVQCYHWLIAETSLTTAIFWDLYIEYKVL